MPYGIDIDVEEDRDDNEEEFGFKISREKK